eukprot:605534_1
MRISLTPYCCILSIIQANCVTHSKYGRIIFLCPGEYGAAFNIKRIYQQILTQNPCIPKLKLFYNFDISVSLMENSDRIMNNYSAKDLFHFLNSSVSDIDWDYAPKLLRKWDSPYPKLMIYGVNGTTEPLIDGNNTFCNDKWTDCTQMITKKLNRMKDRTFGKNKAVVLKRLSRTNWNGVIAKVLDEYDFKKERWPIYVAYPINQGAFIKTKNMILCKEDRAKTACTNKACGIVYYEHKYGNGGISKWHRCVRCKSMYCTRRCQKYDWNK